MGLECCKSILQAHQRQLTIVGMKKTTPSHIAHHYFKRLYKEQEKVKKGFKPDAIHDFRVAYKKLRAFLRMEAMMVAETSQVKFPHSFKNVYLAAGQIRDRQLFIGRIGPNKRSGNQAARKIHSLEKEIEERKNNNDLFLSRKDFDEMENNITMHLPLLARTALIKDFVQQKLDTVKKISAKKEYRDKELHSVRKCLKDIIYVAAIFREDLRSRVPFTGLYRSDYKKAEQLADALGSFNDITIALSFVSPSEIRKADPGERQYLQSVRRQLLMEKRRLKKTVLRKLSEFKPSSDQAERSRP
ncbi:MAG: CHAD domain-containing protein [Bacteroidetes bacterium]|nr:MAG: CHAD domain-containing protein [Bacteroidota bacterium]